MSFRFYHAIVHLRTLDRVGAVLPDIGLYPQGWEGRNKLLRRFESQGFVAQSFFHPDPRLRAFARRDGSAAVFMRLNDQQWANHDPNREELDVLVYAADGCDSSLAQAIGQKIQVRLHRHSFGDLAYAQRVTRLMTGLSPNGRLLKIPAIRQVAEQARLGSVRVEWRSNSLLSGNAPQSQVVKQGLWLEWLVHCIFSRYCSLVWHGAMCQGNEVDVVGILGENILLAECKDTSLGQNDLIVALHKAKLISADVLFLISTQPLHANVEQLITRHSEEDESETVPCVVIAVAGKTDEALEKALESEVSDLFSHAMKNWIIGRQITMRIGEYYDTNRW